MADYYLIRLNEASLFESLVFLQSLQLTVDIAIAWPRICCSFFYHLLYLYRFITALYFLAEVTDLYSNVVENMLTGTEQYHSMNQ